MSLYRQLDALLMGMSVVSARAELSLFIVRRIANRLEEAVIPPPQPIGRPLPRFRGSVSCSSSTAHFKSSVFSRAFYCMYMHVFRAMKFWDRLNVKATLITCFRVNTLQLVRIRFVIGRRPVVRAYTRTREIMYTHT